jgi:hypothetical protein
MRKKLAVLLAIVFIFSASCPVFAASVTVDSDELKALMEKVQMLEQKVASLEKGASSDKVQVLEKKVADIEKSKSAPAFAPIRFSGDANIEYDYRDSGFGDGLTSRLRLVMESDIDKNIYLHSRLVAKQYVNGSQDGSHAAQAAGYENQAVRTGMEQMYIGFKTANGEIKAGRQPLWLANGMLADINGINAGSITAKMGATNVLGFFGQDGDTRINAAEVNTMLGKVGLGASFMKAKDHYYGANFNIPVTDNATFFAQAARNSGKTADNTGYWFGVKVGNATNPGDFDWSVAYLRVGDNINPNGTYNVNDGNTIGGKGFRFKTHYAVTKNSTLTVVYDALKKINGDNDHKRTDIEYEVRF